MKTYHVYIMSNNTRTLYTGVTNNLEKRVLQHKHRLLPGFTRQYNINRLVYYETFGDIRAAIQREKQIKGWLRAKKVALIVAANPHWRDLSEGWFGKETAETLRAAQGDIRTVSSWPFVCHPEPSEGSFSVDSE